MRTAFLAAVAGQCLLTSAQLIDLDFINAEPDPTFTIALGVASQTITYNQASVLASDRAESLAGGDSPLDVIAAAPEKRSKMTSGPILETRQTACSSNPSTPNIYNAVLDPASSFLADPNLAQQALSAETPPLYTNTFKNLKASSSAHGYMGFSLLSSYNTTACAAKCNKAKLCQSFNIYFERSPTLSPGPKCQDPPGTANIFCVLWGGPVYPENTLNKGQYRAKYQVVLAGSNGYTLTSALTPYSTKSINAPPNCNNDDTYLGMRVFSDGAPFDPARCAAVCTDTSIYDATHNPDPSKPPKLCKFYNTYILSRNYLSQGQVCALYSQAWDPSIYAVNDGQYDNKGNRFTISSSVFFKNATDISTPVCPSDVTVLQQDPAAGAFCTSFNAYVAPVTTVTSTTGTTTVQACGAVTPAPAPANQQANKRDDTDVGVIEAVVAVYPQKFGATSTGAPALVTIAAESLTVPGVHESAVAEAASALGLTIPSSSASVPVATAANRRRAATTPSLLAGRDSREIASVCSQVATGTLTSLVSVQATATDVANCAQYPSTCSDGTPPVVIAGGLDSAPGEIDDVYWNVQLPFPICIYDTCSRSVWPTSNGIVSVGDDSPTAGYSNAPLPARGGSATLFAFWDDLYIYGGQRHYMDYVVCGASGSRTVTFDWRMGRFAAASDGPLYSFSATFYEAQPSRVYLRYYGTTDQGSSATVGMEGMANGQVASYQYSYNEGKITNGLGLIFDFHANYFGPAGSR